MPSQLSRNINKIAVYVPGAVSKRQNFRIEVAENPLRAKPSRLLIRAQNNALGFAFLKCDTPWATTGHDTEPH